MTRRIHRVIFTTVVMVVVIVAVVRVGIMTIVQPTFLDIGRCFKWTVIMTWIMVITTVILGRDIILMVTVVLDWCTTAPRWRNRHVSFLESAVPGMLCVYGKYSKSGMYNATASS